MSASSRRMAATSWVSLLDQAACSNSSMCRDTPSRHLTWHSNNALCVTHSAHKGNASPPTHAACPTALHTCQRAVWHLVVLIVAAAAATTLSLNATPALPSSVRTVSCARAPQKSSSLWVWCEAVTESCVRQGQQHHPSLATDARALSPLAWSGPTLWLRPQPTSPGEAVAALQAQAVCCQHPAPRVAVDRRPGVPRSHTEAGRGQLGVAEGLACKKGVGGSRQQQAAAGGSHVLPC